MTENPIVNSYLRLFELMPIQFKVDLIAGLSQSLKKQLPTTPIVNKQLLFEELKGVWKDRDDDLEQIIIDSRTISDREINLD
ncbi:MAG: hypothetical protein AAGI23_05965 [Bacteroidota bacterium]